MKLIDNDAKAGLYFTVIIHLAVLIVLLVTGIGVAVQKENSFVLDFSQYEQMERMRSEIERLEREIAFKQAITQKLEEQIGEQPMIRSVAVDRSALKDDRNTDAEQLYKDAERLQRELNRAAQVTDNSDDYVISPSRDASKQNEAQESSYTGPSVISYDLAGRKASHLPIPAYRCIGAGKVTVIITVNPSGSVINAQIDEAVSSSDSCLRSFAIRAARLSRFSAQASAAPKQIGNIVYEFIAQ